MKRTSLLYLCDIIESIENLKSFTENVEYNDFAVNSEKIFACKYGIQIIGEAISHIPIVILNTRPNIPWNEIKGMRNRIVHEYFGTDIRYLWRVIQIDLQDLKIIVLGMIEEEKNRNEP
jgi:uncharacterized protein with HEPN domain